MKHEGCLDAATDGELGTRSGEAELEGNDQEVLC